jgi:hypothetical protein
VGVLEELKEAEARALSRLAELEPLVAEYDQLKREVDQLGLTPARDTTNGTGAAAGGAGPRRRPARASSTRRPGGSRAGRQRSSEADASAQGAATGEGERAQPGGQRARSGTTRRRGGAARGSGSRRDDVLRLVGQSEGITVREIGTKLGVDPTGLYRVARALENEGAVRREGTRLVPAAS